MNDAHLDGAYRKQVYFRSPFLEFKDEELNEVGIEIANNMSSPRVIKTHLPVNLLPKQIHEKKCKVCTLVHLYGNMLIIDILVNCSILNSLSR